MSYAQLDEYQHRFENIRLERDDEGVLEVTFHTDGDSLVWTFSVHEQIASAWDFIARDHDNRVVIVTGAGDSFTDREVLQEGEQSWFDLERHQHIMRHARRIVLSHLDIEVPMIAAVNGHSRIHSEQAFLCDIIVAAEGSMFADACHFLIGVPPCDGIQTIFPWALGFNRGRAILLTGDQFSAEQALAWGAVYEVLPRDQVLDRARAIAHQIAKKPNIALRNSRALITQPLKKAMIDSLASGLPTGAFSFTEFAPARINPYGEG